MLMFEYLAIMNSVLTLLFGLMTVVADPDDFPTFKMHELCGKNVNFRRESVFSAKIELLPAAILETYPEVTNDTLHCTLSIESWSFQNRLMVHFEEVSLIRARECGEPILEILDGPIETSPRVTGYPSSCVHAGNLMSRSFVTTDRHMTLRFHGNHTLDRTALIRAVIVSFNAGTCRSYEYQCFNGRCIMNDLVCNGHNPCGDNSDCPTTVPPPREMEKNEHVMLAVIIAASATLVTFVIVSVVLYKCYQIRRKHRRLHHQNEYEVVNSSATRQRILISTQQPSYERTVSQIEAEIRYAPPSYSQLPVLENQSDLEEETITEPEEQLPNEINFDTCLEPDDRSPPSYACVMLYQDAFNVSETNIHDLTKERTETSDTVEGVKESVINSVDT